MSYVRCDGLSYPQDPELDQILQTIIGDIKRLQVGAMRGSDGTAFLRRDMGLSDLSNPAGAISLLNEYSSSVLVGFPAGSPLVITNYSGVSGTHICNSATVAIVAFMCGAGGGGGGGEDLITRVHPGGGGGGAGAALTMMASVSKSAAIGFTLGARGTGGVANGNGSDGGTSTISIGADVWSVGGGKGGYSGSLLASAPYCRGGRGGQYLSALSLNPLVIPCSGGSGSNGGITDPTVQDVGAPPPLTEIYSRGTSGVGGTGYSMNGQTDAGQGGNGADPEGLGNIGDDGTDGFLCIAEYAA